jgi:two-component system response regulator PilR (NtrC family)
VIQENSVRPLGSQSDIPTDVLLRSARHFKLAEEVRHQRFRQDLSSGINVIELRLPSLPEQREDIPELKGSV